MKRLCAQCGKRPAGPQRASRAPRANQHIVSDSAHDLCRQCHQSIRDALYARRIFPTERWRTDE